MTHRTQSNKNAALMFDECSRNFKSFLCGEISVIANSAKQRYQSPFRRVSQFLEFWIAEKLPEILSKLIGLPKSANRNISAIEKSTMPPTMINIT
jgi:predicted transcriptional regulator